MSKPTRFVNLHAHTGFSSFDGLGFPQDHFEWCIENGLDAHAITEHGQMNSFAHAYLWAKTWNKDHPDKPFKFLPGVEAYFHPSLTEWSALKEQMKVDSDAIKRHNEIMKREAYVPLKPGDLLADPDDTGENVGNQLVLENEEESKGGGHKSNPLNRRHHLVLLAKDSVGLQKIYAAISRSYLKGFYRFPRMDPGILGEVGVKGHVIATTACIGGPLAYEIFAVFPDTEWGNLNDTLLDDPAKMDEVCSRILPVFQTLVEVFGFENLYLELQFNKMPQQHLVNRAIIEFAKRNNFTAQLIVTCDAHYPRPELWREREIYKKLGHLNYEEYNADSLPKSRDDLLCELYPKNVDQLWDTYKATTEGKSYYDEDMICAAVQRTHDIAHKVIGEVKQDMSIKLPQKIIPKGMAAIDYLIELCKKGMAKRKLTSKPEYVERLKEELGVIKKLNVSEYFVTLHRTLELARDVTLIGPGRGSGSGSLVNYVLYNTELDPIVWNLPFSRFLSAYRVGMADVDTDVGDRDKVLAVLRAEFGYENVVPISNYNTFKVKSLLKDLSKFYGIPYEEVNAATKTVEQSVRKATTKHGDDKNLFVLTYEDALIYDKPFKAFIDKHPEVGESMTVLFKQNRSLGRHAGGVLICDDLKDKMPLITSAGEPQSPWVEGVNFKHLEKVGNFIKYDILGLETLRLIERTIELILERSGVEPVFSNVRKWFDENMGLDIIDLNDQHVYEYVYHSARWAAIFQCTSVGAQRFFVKSKPRSIIDIAALTSIYRPGPLAAKVDKLWLEHETDPYDWGHPLINETLKKTRGLLVFQESVMELANKVGGFPMEQCDEIRRAIMKRSISGGEAAKKAAHDLEQSFIDGAVKNGVPESIAKKAYETILWMSGYGFNQAHAVAYAIDSYYCAWLMTYYEEEWLCAYLEASSNNPDDKSRASSTVRSLGYEIVPIDINYADETWRILPGKKFMPSFLSCKGIGKSAVQEIKENRPYKTIEDVLWNSDGTWRHSKFNKRGLEGLISIGGFDSLDCIGSDKTFATRHQMHHIIIENNNDIRKSSRKDALIGKKSFYELTKTTRELVEWTAREIVDKHIEYLGSFDGTTLIPPAVLKVLADKGVQPIDEYEEQAIYWFIIVSAVVKKSKNGKDYVLAEVIGGNDKRHKMFIWGAKSVEKLGLMEPSVATVSQSDFGFSTNAWQLRRLNV